MIDFIIANKEWLFSGIGVAVIGLLARWLLKSYKTARSKKIDSYQELSQTILSRREKPDNFYDISLKETLDVLKSNKFTEIQKEQFKESIENKIVRWAGSVESVLQEKDRIRLGMSHKRLLSVTLIEAFFELKRKDHLVSLKRGTKVVVEGRVIFDNFSYPSLYDASLFNILK